MVVAAVDEALTVVLVVEPAGDPRDRGSPELLSVFRRAGVVHHRLGIADNRADEGQVAPVWRPDRAGCALRDKRDLARIARTPRLDHEDLIRRPAAAPEGEATSVRRPFGRVISPRRGGRIDGLCLEQAPDHDPASVLAGLAICPAELVGDTL